MSNFAIEELIDKMADCEFLYFTFIFRIIFGVLALILIGIILLIPLILAIYLCLYCDAKCGMGQLVISIIIYILEIFYIDFIKNAFIKTSNFFFVLSC